MNVTFQPFSRAKPLDPILGMVLGAGPPIPPYNSPLWNHYYCLYVHVCTLYVVGGQVDVRNSGKTALHMSALKNHVDVVRLLVNHDADVAAADDAGNTPMHYSIYKYHRHAHN